LIRPYSEGVRITDVSYSDGMSASGLVKKSDLIQPYSEGVRITDVRSFDEEN
jgi:hypothetical protein